MPKFDFTERKLHVSELIWWELERRYTSISSKKYKPGIPISEACAGVRNFLKTCGSHAWLRRLISRRRTLSLHVCRLRTERGKKHTCVLTCYSCCTYSSNRKLLKAELTREITAASHRLSTGNDYCALNMGGPCIGLLGDFMHVILRGPRTSLQQCRHISHESCTQSELRRVLGIYSWNSVALIRSRGSLISLRTLNFGRQSHQSNAATEPLCRHFLRIRLARLCFDETHVSRHVVDLSRCLSETASWMSFRSSYIRKLPIST